MRLVSSQKNRLFVAEGSDSARTHRPPAKATDTDNTVLRTTYSSESYVAVCTRSDRLKMIR